MAADSHQNCAIHIVSEAEMLADESKQLNCRREKLRLYKDNAKPRGAFGIGCSGGGIRSATFNLGILQALSDKGFLPRVDYLSTVSGGGYIGSWLHGVIRNRAEGNPRKTKPYLAPPERRPHARDVSEDPIMFLRKYSSYLAPSLGLFSADFWAILVIWSRNTFLNLLMIIPLLGAISLLAFVAGLIWARTGNRGLTNGEAAFLIVAAILSAAAAAVMAARGVRGAAAGAGEDCSRELPENSHWDRTFWVVVCALLLLLTALAVALLNQTLNALTWKLEVRTWWGVVLALTVLFMTLQLVGGFWKCSAALRRSSVWASIGLVYPLIAALATTGLISLLVWWMATWVEPHYGAWHVIAWGPPLIVLAWLTGAAVHIGLMGADYWDFAREWLARVGAFLSIMAFSWALLFALTIFGPYWIASLTLNFSKTAAAMGSAWVATTVAGIFGGKSDGTARSKSESGTSTPLEWITKIAPTVFMAGFLVLISFAAFIGFRAMTRTSYPAQEQDRTRSGSEISVQFSAQAKSGSHANMTFSARRSAIPHSLDWLADIRDSYWLVLDPALNPGGLRAAFIVLLGCGALVLIVPFFVNINEFSMHHFYKNRLVRCYLGASRGKKRRPSPVTGFDSCDDFPLHSLLAATEPDAECAEVTGKEYLGPYAILCGTVNLDRGSELARQERQGESFIFTPLYCGFDPPESAEDRRAERRGVDLSAHGYRETRDYTTPAGPRIGTCMGISGAAANPNHGYHTSAPVAFLLTIFDVRLGWWLRNSRRKKGGEKPGPSYALLPLFSELFAQTDQSARWLNVSDGGQFENLGLYELVRRRCRYIIIGDGEQDGDYTFESLGGAIRKCRTDFGVDIDIDPRRIRPVKDAPSGTHCVVGTIRYPTKDASAKRERGWILYLKSSLTGDEAEDVAQYAVSHRDFPHQSTGNQFFTESQFESYRKLGWHVAQSAFENVAVDWHEAVPDGPGTADALESMFQCLEQQWYAPASAPTEAAVQHADTYSELMRRLSEYHLRELAPQLFGWEKEIIRREYRTKEDRKIFLYCLELIQLMENVWSDLRLDRAADRDGPRNAGWVRVFRHWAKQPAIVWAYGLAEQTWNPLFRQFFRSMQAQEEKKFEVATPCERLPEPPEC